MVAGPAGDADLAGHAAIAAAAGLAADHADGLAADEAVVRPVAAAAVAAFALSAFAFAVAFAAAAAAAAAADHAAAAVLLEVTAVQLPHVTPRDVGAYAACAVMHLRRRVV